MYSGVPVRGLVGDCDGRELKTTLTPLSACGEIPSSGIIVLDCTTHSGCVDHAADLLGSAGGSFLSIVQGVNQFGA